MSSMGRERFDELMEAYALNALPDDERREFERYLSAHPERQAEVDELNNLAGLLALSPAEHEPSPALRRNLMAVVEGEARESRAATRRTNRRSALARVREFLSPSRLALGAAALLVIGLFSWNLLLMERVDELRGEVAEVRRESQPTNGAQMVELEASGPMRGARVELVRLEGERAVLVAEGLPPIGEDETLQIWVIKDDVPQPAGLLEPEDEIVSTPVEESLQGADTVAITVEPDGGSPAPTSDPTMSANL
jgi:anti-sigma-K factor RskA